MFFHSFAGFLDLWSGYNIIFYYRTSSVTFHRSIDNLWDTVCFLRRIAWTDTGLWTSLLARGTPVNVQEHSMIYWNDRLYVFGGVFAQAGECPFWLYHIQVRRNVFLLMYNSVSNVTWNLSTFFSLSFPTKIDKSTWIRCWDKKKSFPGNRFKNRWSDWFVLFLVLFLFFFILQTSVWEEWQCPRGQNAPQSRKAHTAVTYGSAMYIYGGYQDMRGSLSELWQFSFGSYITAYWSALPFNTC